MEEYLNHGHHQKDKIQYLNKFFAKDPAKIDIAKNNKYKLYHTQENNNFHEMKNNGLRKYLAQGLHNNM